MNKAGNKRGALMKMKQLQMKDKELVKLEGQQMMLMEQLNLIDDVRHDKNVIQSQKEAAQVIKQLNKEISADEIMDLKDALEEMKADQAER